IVPNWARHNFRLRLRGEAGGGGGGSVEQFRDFVISKSSPQRTLRAQRKAQKAFRVSGFEFRERAGSIEPTINSKPETRNPKLFSLCPLWLTLHRTTTQTECYDQINFNSQAQTHFPAANRIGDAAHSQKETRRRRILERPPGREAAHHRYQSEDSGCNRDAGHSHSDRALGQCVASQRPCRLFPRERWAFRGGAAQQIQRRTRQVHRRADDHDRIDSRRESAGRAGCGVTNKWLVCVLCHPEALLLREGPPTIFRT